MGELRNGYSFFAVVGLVLSFVYLAAAVFVVMVPFASLAPDTRDTISGILLSMSYYGIPVMMFLAGFGLLYSFVSHLRGKLFVAITIIVPWLFLLVVRYFWPMVY